MPAALRPTTLCALTLLAGCSIDFDRFLHGRGDGGASTDLGVSPRDTGVTPPRDTGVTPPRDTGVIPPVDTGPARDTGVVTPTDTGVVTPTGCAAPYLVAVAEHLDSNASTLLRWSFADDRRCADLPLAISHARAVGVAFNTSSDLGGPQIIVANGDAVSAVDALTGAVIRDVPLNGPPRSIFDVASNGAGSFAVAYSFTGDSPPGSVGDVRVFDHRSDNLREVQRWVRGASFGSSVFAMTAFPGNQGQYLTVRPADTGSGTSVYVTSPASSGQHPLSMPALIPSRQNVSAFHAYRAADRRGHYALAMSGGSSTPVVYVATSEVSSSSVRDVFVPGVRCGAPCPAITRAVAHPDGSDTAAAICELSGTEYTVVRVGGSSLARDCVMLQSAQPGRWRINDLAVVPR